MQTVAEVRDFNRFYTRQIGLLREHLPPGECSLAEARVVYELAKGGEQTAADLARTLDMDKAHLSRIVARFRTRGLVASRVSPDHGKHRLLSLTEAGRALFARLDQGSRAQMEAILAPLDDGARGRLTHAMGEIRTLLDPGDRTRRPADVRLRPPEIGDLGWVVHRHAVLYDREYGFDRTFEGMVAEIVGRFSADFDPRRDDAWIAEHAGRIAGSVFLVRGEAAGAAKLRLLYVEPDARGLGIGGRLVDACIARARALGYRRLDLWTNDILVAARRIYQAAGFTLVESSPHRSFGLDLVGEVWTLDLAATDRARAPA
ncbi:DNA-binding MarR family transcriptional regulator/GNAT superfamily N-acetyltransferase [Constrictibacter sp. MBR-5]